jgi:peptide deformylase
MWTRLICYKNCMAILEILKYPDPNLKKKSQPVIKIDEEIRRLVADMAETMYAAPGIGLAAPQVGRHLRIVVIDITPPPQPKNLLVLINPEIVAGDGEITWEEGCLSVPELSEEVKRKKQVTVRYQNLEGENCAITGEDLLAVVLQHEIDHLDGILFLDRLSKLKKDLYRRKIQKERREKQL